MLQYQFLFRTLFTIILGVLFVLLMIKLAANNPAPEQPKKRIVRKIISWIFLVLATFECTVAIIMLTRIQFPSKMVDVPITSNMVVRPFNAIQGWGFPTSEQNSFFSLLNSFFIILSLALYCFNFKKSNISWFKKVLKVIYIILMIMFFNSAFNIQYFDFYGMQALIMAAITMIIANVGVNRKKAKLAAVSSQEANDSEEIAAGVTESNHVDYMAHEDTLTTQDAVVQESASSDNMTQQETSQDASKDNQTSIEVIDQNSRHKTKKSNFTIAYVLLSIVVLTGLAFIGILPKFHEIGESPKRGSWETIKLSQFPNSWYRVKDTYSVYGREWKNIPIEEDETNQIARFAYYVGDKEADNYGEGCILRIYNGIEDIEKFGDERAFRDDYVKTKCTDSSLYRVVNDSKYSTILKTGVMYHLSSSKDNDKRESFYEQDYIVLANDLIYSFVFFNDGGSESTKDRPFLSFDECGDCFAEVFDQIDFEEYGKFEATYRSIRLWDGILIAIILIALMCIAFISYLGAKTTNLKARKLHNYTAICTLLTYIGFVILYLINNVVNRNEGQYLEDLFNSGDTPFCMALYLIVATVLYSILLHKTKQLTGVENGEGWLIPYKIVERFGIKTITQKRLVTTLVYAPLYYIFPVPVAGWLFGIYVLLPVVLLLLIGFFVVKFFKWLFAEKLMQLKPTNINIKKISSEHSQFCRYCGGKIEADSVYCKHCGKKLK